MLNVASAWLSLVMNTKSGIWDIQTWKADLLLPKHSKRISSSSVPTTPTGPLSPSLGRTTWRKKAAAIKVNLVLMWKLQKKGKSAFLTADLPFFWHVWYRLISSKSCEKVVVVSLFHYILNYHLPSHTIYCGLFVQGFHSGDESNHLFNLS